MQLDLFDISGRYAVVTGANRGLGLGIAEGFAKAGANLVLISRTMPEEVLEKLRAYGVEVANFHCDFSQPQTIAPLVKDILARYPKIDILVNVAGTQRRNACVDFTDEDWDFVHAVNEKSPFILCREFGRHMVANHYGKIINFASLLSYQGGLRVPAYAASKGAVMQFTKSLANVVQGQRQRQLHRPRLLCDRDEHRPPERSGPQRADHGPHPRRPLGPARGSGRRSHLPCKPRFRLRRRHCPSR